MNTAVVASALCILVAGVAGATAPGGPSGPPRVNTSFAVTLYRSVSAEGGNVLVSPLSVSTTLAMVYAGARGATAAQFAQVLAEGQDVAQFHTNFGRQNARMLADCKQEQCVLKTANAVWVRKGLPLLKSYATLLNDCYAAEAAQVDFAADAEAARNLINSWVDGHTAGKIAELFPKGSPGAGARVVLTNAIYFKGKWAQQFNKDETADAPFTLFDGSTVVVPTMHTTGEFSYKEDERFQALEMPYGDGKFSMVILLPRSHDDLREFEARLSADGLSAMLSGMHGEEVQVALPRFTIRYNVSLGKRLQAMGLTDAFAAPPADFSALDGSKDLYVSEVIHEAFIEVNEEGSEAAAATGAGMMATSVRQVKEFTADRSFLFVIRHTGTGGILFMGCLMHPGR